MPAPLPPAPNPYAPPGTLGADLPAPQPLPPGVRRFTVDPKWHRALVRRQIARVVVVFAGAIALELWTISHPVFAPALFVYLGVLVVVVAAFLARAVSRDAKRVATYELLVGDRAMRRTVGGFPAAEVLAPEVQGAYEWSRGIWLACDAPVPGFFIARSLAAYDEVRALVASRWHPIERVSAWRGWRILSGGGLRQGTRDAVAGTALERDPSLGHELESLRLASSTAWMAHPQLQLATRRRVRRVVLLWAALIVMFLLVWQVLSTGGSR
ncbi:MAG TPA: hypothetical protein VIY73_19625 [Polyangiaceae bacterium]